MIRFSGTIFFMRSISILIITAVFLSFALQSDFLKDQKRYSRVRTAIAEKGSLINQELKERDLALDDFQLLMVAYKASDELELYVTKKTSETYHLLKTYKICSKSGSLGPKRKQGDRQVPEGFYYIDRFNPASNFYLSLGINYPNSSDRILSKASNLGGDIFIHGACVTIGCLPMTTDKIKEIYMYAVHAKNNGQNKIPVYIFHYRMTKANNQMYFGMHMSDQPLINFWMNLKKGFQTFQENKKALNYKVNQDGSYSF